MKRSLKANWLSDFASFYLNAVYSAAESEERALCFLCSSFFLWQSLPMIVHLYLFVGKVVTFLRYYPFFHYRFCHCHNHSFCKDKKPAIQ